MAETFIRENEKKDAIAKLTDKLGDNFLKNPAVLAAAGTLAAGTAAVVSQLDQKAKEVTGEDVGFMDSFRDWLKDAANKSDGVMKKIWMFFYTLISWSVNQCWNAFGSRKHNNANWATLHLLSLVLPRVLLLFHPRLR